MLVSITDKINTFKYFPTQKDSPKPPEPVNLVSTIRRAPPLDGGQYTKIGVIWTMKHEISSPRFHELPIKTELKGDTSLNLKKFYNHIKMCINAVTRL